MQLCTGGAADGAVVTGGRSEMAALAPGIAVRMVADKASNPALKRQTRARRFILKLQPIIKRVLSLGGARGLFLGE